MKFSSLWRRLVRDYGGVNHLDGYADLLLATKSRHYDVLTVCDFWKKLNGSGLPSRYLVLRHDIDTDPDCALEFSRIECEFGVKATYYFRVSTAKCEIVKAIAAAGHDIGYHCEDLATVAKQQRVKSAVEMLDLLPQARAEALKNIMSLRQLSEKPVCHASSHGDFMNRRMRVTNDKIFDDTFRARAGICFEAYDPNLNEPLSDRVSDAIGADAALGRLKTAMIDESRAMYFLSHPREWRSGGRSVLVADIKRVLEGLNMLLPVKNSNADN